MNEIKRYRPSFCEGFPEESQEFESLEELLRIPWIKKWEESDGFFKWAKSCRPLQSSLMALFDGGKKWWVAGFIKDAESLDLPNLTDVWIEI